MASYKHIFITGNVSSEKYRAPSGMEGKPRIPVRDRVSQSQKLLSQFDDIWRLKAQLQQQRGAEQIAIREGTYISFTSAANHDLITKSLEDLRKGIRLLNIKEIPVEENKTQIRATIYVPNGKEGLFISKINSYRTKNNTTITFQNQVDHESTTDTINQLENNISVKSIKDITIDGLRRTKALINLPVEQEEFFISEILLLFPKTEIKITPSNADLVNSIEDVSIALLEGLWTDNPQQIPLENTKWCEVWLNVNTKENQEQEQIAQFLTTLEMIVTENGTPYTMVNDGGVWYLDAATAATAGNYALQLYFTAFAGLANNQFGILRRIDGSSNAADWAVPAGSALEPANGAGRKVSDGYARRKNITTFSQFGIGMTSVALPVELINFLAVRENITWVKLTWSTATEVNNKGFEVERRLDNENHFNDNGFVASKSSGGNSQLLLNYSYSDLNSFSGVSYYRIKQIDFDNHSMYTAIKAVKGSSNTTVDVTILPNPNHGQFKILMTGVMENHQAFITDINGKVLKRLIVQPQQEVNVLRLPAATYILTIIDVFGKGNNFKEKIMIVK